MPAKVTRLRELRRKLQAEVARLEAEKQGWLVEKARDGPNAIALGVEPGPASYERGYADQIHLGSAGAHGQDARRHLPAKTANAAPS